MKKIAVILLVVGLIYSFYNISYLKPVYAEKAVEYDPASVVMIDNLDEYDTKSVISWSCELIFSEDREKEVSDYASFTLEEDSIIKMGVKYTEIGTWMTTSPDVLLYSNKAMTVKKLDFGFYNSGDSEIAYLPAGTYYIEAKDKRVKNPKVKVKIDVSICALPVTKVLSVISQLDENNTKATVTVTQALGGDLENIQYIYGAYDEKDNKNYRIWSRAEYQTGEATLLTGGNTFTVKKNGTYTIRICTKDRVAYSIQHKIEGLGKIASKKPDVKNEESSKKTETVFTIKNNSKMNYRSVIICIITLIIITGGVMGVFIFTHRKKVRYYKELSENYKEQFTQKYSYFQNYKEKQSDIAKFRHDWKNHMLLLQEMLNHGEYEKAKTYFTELSEKTVQSQQRILTGNEILDLILASKADELEQNQIPLTCNGKLETFHFMEDVDCCSLFSNLIDNAIEANLKLEQRRYITITTNRTNKLLYVEISNPMKDMAKVIETGFQTTKKESEKHGIGLKNVYEIFRKYHIEYYIITNEQEFSIQMLFEI
ncbi:MAG: sensor histidine kinase [Clostridiales bacterium]|nr:sensor histidine kinase [Clostridiales bacterium]